MCGVRYANIYGGTSSRNLHVLLFTNILPIKMSNSNTGLDKIHKILLKLAIRNDNFFSLKLPMKYFRSSCIDLIVISSSIVNPSNEKFQHYEFGFQVSAALDGCKFTLALD